MVMQHAKVGDTVKVVYSTFTDDYTILFSSLESEPFEFTIGHEMVISGFEKAVIGMREGDIKTVWIDPKDGYGEHRNDLVMRLRRNQIPDDIEPSPGMVLQLRLSEGRIVRGTIVGQNERYVVIDANHPLAGKRLTVEIRLLAITA